VCRHAPKVPSLRFRDSRLPSSSSSPALRPFRPSRRPTVNSLTTRDDFLRSDRHCRSSLAQSTNMTYFIARRLCPLHNRSPSVTLRVDSTNYSKTCPYIWVSYGKNSFAGPILSKCLFTYSNINIFNNKEW